jgi:hypothetical protein
MRRGNQTRSLKVKLTQHAQNGAASGRKLTIGEGVGREAAGSSSSSAAASSSSSSSTASSSTGARSLTSSLLHHQLLLLLRVVVAVERGAGQVALDLAGLPDLQTHADVQDHQDEHGEDEEEEGAELVHRICLKK